MTIPKIVVGNVINVVMNKRVFGVVHKEMLV